MITLRPSLVFLDLWEFLGLKQFFFWFLWWICRSVLGLCDQISNAMYFLSGVKKININNKQRGFFDLIFGITPQEKGIHYEADSIIIKMLPIMSIFLVVMLVISFSVMMIKRNTQEDNNISLRSVGSMIGKSVFLYFLLPMLIPLFLVTTSTILNVYSTAINPGASGTELEVYFSDAVLKSLVHLKEGAWIDRTALNADTLEAYTNNWYSDVDWVPLLFISITVFIALGLSIINVASKGLELLFMFFSSPFVIGMSPMDDGYKYNNLKSNIMTKLFSVGGSALSLLIFLWYLKLTEPVTRIEGFGTILYLALTIGGAFSVHRANVLIASLFSPELGHQEAQLNQTGMGLVKMSAGLTAGSVALATAGAKHFATHKPDLSLGKSVGGSNNLLDNSLRFNGLGDGGESASLGTLAASTQGVINKIAAKSSSSSGVMPTKEEIHNAFMNKRSKVADPNKIIDADTMIKYVNSTPKQRTRMELTGEISKKALRGYKKQNTTFKQRAKDNLSIRGIKNKVLNAKDRVVVKHEIRKEKKEM